MAWDFNYFACQGRLTKDPERVTTKSGKEMVRFSIANNRGQDICNFINCIAFGKVAEFLATNMRKGSAGIFAGSLKIDKYTDKNGVEKQYPVLTVDTANFTSAPKRDDSAPDEPVSGDVPF